MLPDGIVERLQNAADPREEGIRICAETIRAMREIPGLAGVNLMATRDLTAIPEVIREAGLHD
jgi:methylenetetrahydrofolate reductase (NADPH)